jgi:hypothetical protein
MGRARPTGRVGSWPVETAASGQRERLGRRRPFEIAGGEGQAMEPERLVERQLVAEVRRLGHRRHGDVRRLSRGDDDRPEPPREDSAVNEGFRCSPLPALCPARLPARRPSVTTERMIGGPGAGSGLPGGVRPGVGGPLGVAGARRGRDLGRREAAHAGGGRGGSLRRHGAAGTAHHPQPRRADVGAREAARARRGRTHDGSRDRAGPALSGCGQAAAAVARFAAQTGGRR